MKIGFICLCILTSGLAPADTHIVFQDHEVPHFLVVETNGKKRVVIDSSHLKSEVSDKRKTKTDLARFVWL